MRSVNHKSSTSYGTHIGPLSPSVLASILIAVLGRCGGGHKSRTAWSCRRLDASSFSRASRNWARDSSVCGIPSWVTCLRWYLIPLCSSEMTKWLYQYHIPAAVVLLSTPWYLAVETAELGWGRRRLGGGGCVHCTGLDSLSSSKTEAMGGRKR